MTDDDDSPLADLIATRALLEREVEAQRRRERAHAEAMQTGDTAVIDRALISLMTADVNMVLDVDVARYIPPHAYDVLITDILEADLQVRLLSRGRAPCGRRPRPLRARRQRAVLRAPTDRARVRDGVRHAARPDGVTGAEILTARLGRAGGAPRAPARWPPGTRAPRRARWARRGTGSPAARCPARCCCASTPARRPARRAKNWST